jgi:hypothetical protein
MEQQPRQTDNEDYSALATSRFQRLQRIRRRAHNSISQALVAYDMAKWAVTFAVLTERDPEARRVKREDAQRGLRNLGKVTGILRSDQ